MKKLFSISVFFSLLFLFYSHASAEVPQMINYQGKLTKSTGAPVDTTIPMVFTIYADSGGTISKWSETQTAVKVEKGVFNVLLGSVNPIPDSVFDGSIRYLGVKVGGDPEITPRKAMVSVAYAYRAGVGGGGGDNDWVFPQSAGGNNPRPYLYTYGPWGIARYGNVLWGTNDSTHVNLGVACITGTSGQNYKYCTVGGGVGNTASGINSTIGGGNSDTASGYLATIAGGHGNTASGSIATIAGGELNHALSPYTFIGGGSGHYASASHATVGGGYNNASAGAFSTIGGGNNNYTMNLYGTIAGGLSNTAGGFAATIAGGDSNSANGLCAAVVGGDHNSASGDYSVAMGRWVTAGAAANTIVLGKGVSNVDRLVNNIANSLMVGFDRNTPTLFVDSSRVGIGTSNPQRALHISDVMRLQPRASAPASPSEGDIYVNSTDHHIYCYLNGVWKQLDN
jgi:hypothetical protein